MAGNKARTTGLLLALGLLAALGTWWSTGGAERAGPGPVATPAGSAPSSVDPGTPRPPAASESTTSGSAAPRRNDVGAPVAAPRAVHPARAFSEVKGRIVEDATSEPVVGAHVELSLRLHAEFSNLDLRVSRTEHEVGATRSDGEGRFSVRVPSDNPLALLVGSPGYASARLDHVFGGEKLEVRLIAGTVLAGRVTRTSTGEPVTGVRLRAWELKTGQELFRIETDAGGNYRESWSTSRPASSATTRKRRAS